MREKTNSRLEGIQIRRQKLMDAYEEAKNEHFESIRINIGHPSYYDTLQDLSRRESTRRVSFGERRWPIMEQGRLIMGQGMRPITPTDAPTRLKNEQIYSANKG